MSFMGLGCMTIAMNTRGLARARFRHASSYCFSRRSESFVNRTPSALYSSCAHLLFPAKRAALSASRVSPYFRFPFAPFLLASSPLLPLSSPPVHTYMSTPDLYSDPSALDILKSKGAAGRAVTIEQHAPVIKAARIMTATGAGALIVMQEGHVVGIITEKDVLRHLVAVDDMTVHYADALDAQSSLSDSTNRTVSFLSMHTPVHEVMTPATRMVVVTPEDPSSKCLALMLNRNIRHLPVLKDNTLLGVLSVRDMTGLLRADDNDASSAKARYLTEILPRLGVPTNTKILRAESEFPLFLHSAAFVIPHPDKKATGGEDAHFMISQISIREDQQDSASEPPSKSRVLALSYIGVADGVGSWSVEQGIDVSQFSRALIKFCQESALSIIKTHSRRLSSPMHILSNAWTKINKEQAANLGDSGFLVLRHHSRMIAGSLHSPISRDKTSSSPYQVVFRSTQQLHSFNTPLQLGLNSQGHIVCEQPSDAEIVKLSVEEDDLIILATDGLYDNLEEKDILHIIGAGTDAPDLLAEKIARAAYEASLDRDRDGPFAVLAKENNFLWGGGHRDDITVIVSRVSAARKLTILPTPISRVYRG